MPRRRTGLEKFKRPNGSAQKSILFTFTEEEAALIKAAGALAGPTVTEWGRQVLLQAAEKRMALEAEALAATGTK